MNFEIIKELEKEQLKAEVPQFATGDTVRVHNRIKEGTRERVQIFEGTVIKIQGGGARINGEQITDKKYSVTEADFRDGELVLQKGKKKYMKIICK